MSKLSRLEPIIEEILRNNPAARKDDFILVLEVYKRKISPNTPISLALENHKELGLTPFASIIRVRRMLQQRDPSLCDAPTVAIRSGAEADYKDYAKEG